MNQARAATLTTSATIAGRTLRNGPTSVVGSTIAAARPTRPSSVVMPSASRGLLSAITPVTAASTPRAVKMPVSRRILSFSPKVRIAQSFTAPGVASMTRPPTAVMGVGEPPARTDTRNAAPTPAAAERRPAAAPRTTRVRRLVVTPWIRRRPLIGLDSLETLPSAGRALLRRSSSPPAVEAPPWAVEPISGGRGFRDPGGLDRHTRSGGRACRDPDGARPLEPPRSGGSLECEEGALGLDAAGVLPE